MIKFISITSLFLISCISFELSPGYYFDDSPCNNQSKIKLSYASLGLVFNTDMENDIKSFRVGAMVTIPCTKRDSYKITIENQQIGGFINERISSSIEIDSGSVQEEQVAYNPTVSLTDKMTLEETQNYINNHLMNDEAPVVKTEVILRENEATVSIYRVVPSFMEKLEEYGVRFDLNEGTYNLNQEMKQELIEKMRIKQEQKPELSEIITQDILNKIKNGQTEFIETKPDGSQVKVVVSTQMKVVNPDEQKTLF